MATTDCVLLPALDNGDKGGVVWRSVSKLVNYINESRCIDKDLHYSLKSRIKSPDSIKVLNTLTVYHTISLNCSTSVRQQLSDKKCLQMFSKAFSRTQEVIVQHAIMQLMMDWSFLFNREELGRRSDRLLHEFCLRKGKSLRPTSLAGEVFQEVNSGAERSDFMRGFEFEDRRDQIVLEDGFEEAKTGTKSCRPPLHHGSFRLGSMKRIFSRSSSRSLASSKRSSIVMELSTQPPQIESKIEELNLHVPPDCKKLQDLLSDLQVLISKKQIEDLESKMQGAESLRNKCVEWKHTIQELISIKLHNNNNGDQSEDEINPSIFAKLLTIGETLHGVLARFEQIHKEYLNQMNAVEDADDESFASARSASSTGSITLQSTGDFNWVQFTTENEFRRSVSLGNDASTKRPINSYRLPTSARSTSSPSDSLELKNGGSPFEGVSQIPRPPPPPPLTTQEGEVSNKEKALIKEKALVKEKALLSEIPKSRSSRLPERSLNLASKMGAPSRSFSELKSVQDQFSNSKRISNCPALKVRFTDDHLEDVMSRMSDLR